MGDYLDNLDSSYSKPMSFMGSSKKIKLNQMMVLFKNPQIFTIFLTFFMSTSLWVYIEPILSLYLIKNYKVADYVTPMFFLVFSMGYLFASLFLFKTRTIQLASKYQSVLAFIFAGLAQFLIAPPIDEWK